MDDYAELASLLKFMAHPMRLQILDQLRCDAECVCHLTAVVGKPQAYVSQQLALLRNAGLIEDHKVGNRVFYSLTDGRMGENIRKVLGPLDEDTGQKRPPEHEKAAGCNCPKCQSYAEQQADVIVQQ